MFERKGYVFLKNIPQLFSFKAFFCSHLHYRHKVEREMKEEKKEEKNYIIYVSVKNYDKNEITL